MKQDDDAVDRARPFRFEDLAGKPEPESWGPTYPKTASAAVEKWRALGRVRELTPDEKRAHGRAVGEWIRGLNNPAARRHSIPASDLHYKLTCEKIRGQQRAAFAAAAAADRRAWAMGQDIALAYAACPKLGDRKPKKPHYLLVNGQFKLAA